MNTNLRKINHQIDNILKELEVDMQTTASPDIKAYLELNELVIRIDKITLLMLSDIGKKRVLN
jgi:hypothetical protein